MRFPYSGCTKQTVLCKSVVCSTYFFEFSGDEVLAFDADSCPWVLNVQELRDRRQMGAESDRLRATVLLRGPGDSPTAEDRKR